MKLLARRKPLYVDPAPHTRQMFDNYLVCTDGTVLVGFRLGANRWDYVQPEHKQGTLDAVQDGWALLKGLDYQERVTTRPYPVQEWARKLDARTPNPLPDVHLCDQGAWSDRQLELGECGCETWLRHLARMQRAIGGRGLDDKIVFRYFVAGNVGSKDMRAEARALAASGAKPSEVVRDVLKQSKLIKDAVGGPGWNGRPMTLREQRWLRARSLAPGVAAPQAAPGDDDGWDTGEVPALNLDVRHRETEFDRSVEVVAWRDGKKISKRVQVLTLARDPAFLTYPESGLEPWMVYAERATDPEGYAFGAEWNICGRIMSGAEVKGDAEYDLKRSLHLENDYAEFGEPPREDIGRGIARAKVVRDQVSTGSDREASRFRGSVDILLWGEDVVDRDTGRVLKSAEEVVEERGEAMRRLYGGNQLGFAFVVPLAQGSRLAMATPGEYPAWDRVGYQRQWPLDYHAAALPNVSVAVGDDNGPYMGPTMGTAKRPTMHDTHFATEGRKTGRGQNIWLWIATLGGGKTANCVGSIGYNAVRRGRRTICRDPSGPTLAMCNLPELAPYSTGFNILEGADGILSPPALLRDPVLEEFDGNEKAHRRAMALAQGERSDLTQDIARRALAADLYRHDATLDVLREAARRVVWTRERTMWDLVDALLGMDDDHAARIAGALQDASERPRLSLLFAPRGEGGDYVNSGLKRSMLTIVATPGIKRAPDGVQREDWNHEERAADPIIYLTGLYTGREVYDKPMHEPAVFIADEAEDLTDGSVGRAFLSRFGRDHSKHNIEGHLLLKNLNDMVMSREIMNFVAGAWLGRMATLGPAEEVLDRLGVVDKAYARTLLRLSERRAGQFLHIDALGRPGGMEFDLDYTPWIKDAIFTDPGTATADLWSDVE